jgi:uncharacterized protein
MIAWPILKPMTVGGLMMGTVAWIICYSLVYLVVSAYRERRRNKAAARRARQVPQAEAAERP